jgi:hypothetical protein
MEHQTGFDLNSALIAWKQEMAGQPGVTADNVRELETHLWEAFDTFRGQGLNEAEAFANARRQLGSVEEVGVEFARANPVVLWRERVFWMAFAIFIIQVWGHAVNSGNLFLFKMVQKFFAADLNETVFVLFYRLPISFFLLLLPAVAICAGWWRPQFRGAARLFENRRRFAVAALVTSFFAEGFASLNTFHLTAGLGPFFLSWMMIWGVGSLICIPLLLWLWPQMNATADSVAQLAIRRRRIRWMAAGLLIITAWSAVQRMVNIHLLRPYEVNGSHVPWTSFVIIIAVGLIPAALAVYAGRGGLARWLPAPPVGRTRLQVGAGCSLLLLATFALNLWSQPVLPPQFPQASINVIASSLLAKMTWPISLAAVIVWLTPGTKRSPLTS